MFRVTVRLVDSEFSDSWTFPNQYEASNAIMRLAEKVFPKRLVISVQDLTPKTDDAS